MQVNLHSFKHILFPDTGCLDTRGCYNARTRRGYCGTMCLLGFFFLY